MCVRVAKKWLLIQCLSSPACIKLLSVCSLFLFFSFFKKDESSLYSVSLSSVLPCFLVYLFPLPFLFLFLLLLLSPS